MATNTIEARQSRVLAARQRRRKGNVYDANCPSRIVLDHVTSRWGTLVLLILLDGTHRFSELAPRHRRSQRKDARPDPADLRSRWTPYAHRIPDDPAKG